MAAVAGLALGAATSCAASDEPAESPRAGAVARECCKGAHQCKGKGGCRVEGMHRCAGLNECKGQGGCNGHCPQQ